MLRCYISPRTSGIGGGWTQEGFPPSLWISKNRSYFRIRLYFFSPYTGDRGNKRKVRKFFRSRTFWRIPWKFGGQKKVWSPEKDFRQFRLAAQTLARAAVLRNYGTVVRYSVTAEVVGAAQIPP